MPRVHTTRPAADRSKGHPIRGRDVRRDTSVRPRTLGACAWSPRTRPRPSSDRATACTSTAPPPPRRSSSTASSPERSELRDVSGRPTSTPRVPGRTSRRRWRATSGTGPCSSVRTPGRRSTRVGPTTCRSSCRTCRGSSRPAPCRSTSSSSTRRRPTTTGSARWARASRRCTPRSGPRRRSSSSSTGRCRGRSARASSTSATSTSRSRSTSRPTSHARPAIGDIERRIGEHVAELVPDGATLQLGIGAIPTATALALTDKRDLGIHTEMFTDAVVDLVEAGVVTGAAKERNRGKIVTTFLMGSPRLYDVRPRQPDGRDAAGRLHERHPRHPLVQPDGRDQLRDRGRPDRPGRRRLDRPHALLRRRRPDGLHARRGARRGGRAIIALPSTAAGGTASRIVPASARARAS